MFFQDSFFLQYLEYAILGFIGGLIHVIISRKGVLVLPRFDKKTHTLRLGFLLSGFIGLATAIVVDSNPLTAFFSALAIPYLTESTIAKTASNGKEGPS